MKRKQEIECFLINYRNTYNALESWLDKQILFACAAGFCNVYSKTGAAYTEKQMFILAAKVMNCYLKGIQQDPYLSMLNIGSINQRMFLDIIPEEYWLEEELGTLPPADISDNHLDFLIEWSLQEVVINHIFSSLATFQTNLANQKPILC